MATLRYVIEGTQYQGSNESITYAIADVTTKWGGGVNTPSSPSATIASVDPVTKALTDVTATKMSGSASVSGDDIILPTIASLVDGTLYRVRVTFVISGNTESTKLDIQGEY